jgi:hypothetical protein
MSQIAPKNIKAKLKKLLIKIYYQIKLINISSTLLIIVVMVSFLLFPNLLRIFIRFWKVIFRITRLITKNKIFLSFVTIFLVKMLLSLATGMKKKARNIRKNKLSSCSSSQESISFLN